MTLLDFMPQVHVHFLYILLGSFAERVVLDHVTSLPTVPILHYLGTFSLVSCNRSYRTYSKSKKGMIMMLFGQLERMGCLMFPRIGAQLATFRHPILQGIEPFIYYKRDRFYK